MKYEKTVILPVDPDTAFALVTQPERLRRWSAVAARIDLRLGGDFRWTVVPGNTAGGTITDFEEGKRISYSWGWEGNADLPPGASIVTITLEQVAQGTRLHFVHDGLTEAQAIDHAEGWDHYLSRLLKLTTEGDVDIDPWVYSPEHLEDFTVAESALALAQETLRSVDRSQLNNPTPCKEFTLKELIDHQYGSLVGVAASLGLSIPTEPKSNLEARLADISQPIIEAFRKRGLDGTLVLGQNELPARVVAMILNIELFEHGIDIKIATHQKVDVSEPIADFFLELARNLITPDVRANGSFGPEIPMSDSESSLNRMLAFTGRNVSVSG